MKHRNLFVLLFCFAVCFAVSAQEVSMNLRQVKLEKVFDTITQQTGLTVAYSRPTVNPEKIVSIQADKEELSKLLHRLLADMNVDFEIGETKIYLKAKASPDATKQSGKKKNISGTVIDQNGEPVIGASVLVKGTTNGLITDMDGNYTLTDVPEDAVISISYIGYQTVELRADNKALAKVTLKEDSELLEEVVVVGYGVQKKRDVTTAIASLRASDMKGQPVASMAEAMVGRMPGVQVSQATGAPGSSLQIKVRGTGTITAGTSPLYVVDGVPLAQEQLNTFNLNDVESIEVLKDASSAAIYGSRGSNGVVLITTKKGQEGRATVSYNGFYGWQAVSKKFLCLKSEVTDNII
ncbi:TonB-dependent receptor plug domain-containing protein [Bacteroides zoogleoformans]|uniref:TonB-dependent receptor plug domain-containing protein n=1 Tax=Bacteroides zoogleoformans TaxID=28119 RepID=UPI00248DE5F3|nr:TonB-dependent receptor plug domain-containing protein [Bacteroides zoogleoformans]